MKPTKYTKEYEDWFTSQDEEAKILINAKVNVLQEFGPNIGRPYVDTIKGTKFKNLKELRINHKKYVLRILLIFDKKRNCWLLIGGNKKGKNEEDFYKKIIKQAEDLIKKYSEILEDKDE
jgi:hypothetical protein